MRLVLRRGSILVVSVAIGVLALAGCGGSSSNGVASKSAEEILSTAVTAAKGASSVHLRGSVTSGGKPLALDFQLANSRGATGSMTLNGARAELVLVGGKVYLKGSADFWKLVAGAQGAAAAQLLKDRWIVAPASGEFASLVQITDVNALMTQLSENHGTLTKGAETTVDGQKVIAVVSSKGGTLYVATTGKPYPVQLSKSGSDGGKFSFDKWGASVKLEAPKGAVDLSKITG
jgi:hypothetical protein